MKKCRTCKQLNVRERNGIAVNKYCVKCRFKKKAEKELKHMQTQVYINKECKKLHRKAWKLMSEWIRRKEANADSYVWCYTCDAVSHWKNMQAGHFWHGKLDFDERNIKVQCPRCNKHLSGNLAVYAHNLQEDLGLEEWQKLKVDAHNSPKYTLLDLDKIILDLESKLLKLNET